jgi:hypothetical protein
MSTRLRDIGATLALLGVDGANPHQPMTLYRTAGFEIFSSGTRWRKPLDHGVPR